MMNPWFALSVQALRLGLEAQHTAFAGFLRLVERQEDCAPQSAMEVQMEVQLLPETVERPPAEATTKPALVQAATKIHKRTRRKGRARR